MRSDNDNWPSQGIWIDGIGYVADPPEWVRQARLPTDTEKAKDADKATKRTMSENRA